ncbi:MAG TPA: enoyl-CoA hydratase/isomerase family protein [Blastocatellia bacterium]|nr:enoyl-CoA hydratase/isomerase family protein [Blastocatellia bacterium]
MDNVKLETKDRLLTITLSRGKANALDWKTVDELNQAVAIAKSDQGIRAVVLASDRPRFFSGGFDVSEVFAYDRPAMREFFGRFIALYEGLYHLPKPVVGAIGGHAFAGGAVLGISCDFRVMAQGDYGFALNEINLGVILPAGIIAMAIDAVGFQSAYQLLLTGQPLSPAMALEIGLARELASPETLVERSTALASTLGDKAPGAFAGVKSALRLRAGHPVTSGGQELEKFLDSWFSSEATERRQDLVKSLSRTA